MDIKYLFKEQIILTVLIIFVVLYFIVNFNNIYSGSMFSANNNIRKPLLLALIISLLGYLFVTWDNNSFSEEIPKAIVFWVLVETATKCLTIALSGAWFKNQARILFALLRVSCVVNVLETITNSVVSGFSFLRIS